ncbi:transcription initiation factor IID, 18 kDa subunit, partial [Tilletiopsis washingtonensis]
RRTLTQSTLASSVARLMYACGDVAQPEPASVALLEEMTVEYLTDLCHRARPSPYSVPRVKVDDLKTALRRDDKKLGRIEELLYLDTVITKARRGFDD